MCYNFWQRKKGHQMTTNAPEDSYDRVLAKLGMPRTRENYLWVKYNGEVPWDYWDEDAEMALPEDLREAHL